MYLTLRSHPVMENNPSLVDHLHDLETNMYNLKLRIHAPIPNQLAVIECFFD